ncbi:MAG TPA: PEP/pyruvate-binding domain-containing protein [Nevskiales bacterium]|nr:PEP/pyruvate-binding domain-containing protein [Nevskiales bacterium]
MAWFAPAVFAASPATTPSPAARSSPPAQAPAAAPKRAPAIVPLPEKPTLQDMRAWIEEMKTRERGPFKHIRWFCNDGSVLEPEPFACERRGGGVQHGEWSDKTKKIRESGYPIANVLASIKPEQVVGPQADPAFLPLLLAEKFLIAFDDGWIFRRARFYRGALQDYNEQDSATEILLALLGDPVWRERIVVLYESARLLPHGVSTNVLTQIRGLATTVTEQDPDFARLRDKIHAAPDAGDARRVREYAAGPKAKAKLQADYERLAADIDRAYLQKTLPAALEALARRVQEPALAERIAAFAADLQTQIDPESQLRISGEVLGFIREHLLQLGRPRVRLQALDAGLAAELNAFTATRALLEGLPRASRGQRLAWLGLSAQCLYGLGLLTQRELEEIRQSLARLPVHVIPFENYRNEIQYLERPPGWSARRLGYHFGAAIDRLAALDPMVEMYIPDRLRSSPMLFYSSVLESLAEDVARLGGVRHSLFGQPVSTGLRRLNPGLARGMLYTEEDARTLPAGSPAAIWLVPETTADLPPVAGILTAEEGNALSHVQLLARNLGIPNVVVGRDLLPGLQARRGKPIVLAASRAGVVRIEDDGPQWAPLFPQDSRPQVLIAVNLHKLDLNRRGFIPTSQLSAADSGRSVGPKAAQVGELARHFPGQVSPGLAIPFGAFRALLDRPREAGKPQSMFAWMQAQYAEMGLLAPEPRAQRVKTFLAEVRDWIAAQPFDEAFRSGLREAMKNTFGEDGSYGVFVRSDTNVEDLPGFSGAGLNKTVPNVVGFDNVLKAIKEVWTSPFTERAYGWRQGLMDKPEHVYASVLLHKSVPNEKSGVMITADAETGDRRFLTIVANAGVGGGVEGQAAETLRVYLPTGEVRLMASATAPLMRVLLREGGSRLVEAPAPDKLLQAEEIAQLAALARSLPGKYPPLLDGQGRPAPADIEFGFVDGKLMLFQIRPFLQNQAAMRNQYLAQMDASLRRSATGVPRTVDLREIPPVPAPARPAPAPVPETAPQPGPIIQAPQPDAGASGS